MEVQVARTVRRGIALALVLAGILSSASLAAADPAPAPPLTSRPLTLLKMIETNYSYIPSLLSKKAQAEGEALQKIAAVAPGEAGGYTPPYDRGADVGEIVQNIMKDFQVIIGDFLDCLDFKIIGLCYKITWTGIKFDIYREYRLPVQDVEVVQTPFQSGFIPKFVNNALLPVVQDTYYPMGDTVASTALSWTGQALETQGNLVGVDFQTADADVSTDVEDKLKAIDKKKRFRGSEPVGAGARVAEYTVLPQLFNQTMGRLWFFCHDVLAPGVWSSYYPLEIMPARMSALSFFFFPAEMISKFLVPNSCAGVNNQIRGGHSPFDMLTTGIPAYDGMNLMSPGLGCLKENDADFVPVTNTAHNASFPVDSVNASVKGIKISSRMMPFSFYDINTERDRWQWSHSDRMPDNCAKIEKFSRNFGDANMRKGKDNWNVGIHWRRFRCCQHGFRILIGPRPFIYR
ncbi:MAG: hypothetical protein J0M12_07410 [Deltaproteobacteria bacterium]|nr:hypothetical protein [Deltaproteobacteria bacterium]